METHKCLDNQQSTEIEAALKRFEDVCNSLEDQHTKLLDLEKRREKLNEDLQSLRNEIKEENKYFRSVVNDNSGDRLEGVENEGFGEIVEPATLDIVAIKNFIQKQKCELASSLGEMGIDCLKEKLEKHRSSGFERVNYRMKDAAETGHQYVGEEKCIVTEICNNEDVEIKDTSTKESRDD